MNLSLESILACLAGVDPTVAAIVSIITFVLQRKAAGKSLAPADLLKSLLALFTGGKTAPSVPADEPKSVPPVDAPRSSPTDEPIHADSERLLDILVSRLKDRFRKRIARSGGDDNVAVVFYSRIVSALDAPNAVLDKVKDGAEKLS